MTPEHTVPNDTASFWSFLTASAAPQLELPFAVRCHACEERREEEQGDARQRRVGFSLFPDVISS
jgi:hypothetical protein